MSTIIFDCDGVIAETERDGHRVAFNQAFENRGLAISWSEADYGELLHVGGGKERIRAALGSEPETSVLNESAQETLVAEIHTDKTGIFVDMVLGGLLNARPGFRRIVDLALESGWSLAVASTSAMESVKAVLESAVGKTTAAQFAGIYAGDIVASKKPAPDIYELACRELGVSPLDVVVVEDSSIGSRAAASAGLGHLITVSHYTASEPFPQAAAVMSSLGDPDQPAECLAHERIPAPANLVGLTDLKRCIGTVSRGK